jgi:hypothetical protein
MNLCNILLVVVHQRIYGLLLKCHYLHVTLVLSGFQPLRPSIGCTARTSQQALWQGDRIG